MKHTTQITATAFFLLLAGSLHAMPLPVVGSFSILGDVARQIGGERVSVTTLVGADQDAHAYRLTGGDLKRIAAAKLVLLNGLGLEQGELVKAVQQSRVPYAEATRGITPLKSEEVSDHEEHGHGDFDPHVWNDPVRMQYYAANIAIALIRADPAGARYYQSRFQAYSAQLLQLDTYARQQFAAVPQPQRKILTEHDAFNYLAKRYGIVFLAPQGVSTEGEASAKTIASIIRQIKQNHIKALFTENIKNGRIVQEIARETGVNIGGTLYSDALSSGAPADTYLNLFRYNVHTMSAAMK